MRSGYDSPLNLGTDRMVSVNQLARIIIDISGKPGIGIEHVDGPQGVRGRNSDNTRLREVIGWEPRVSLEEGLVPTYRWIEEQVTGRRASAPDMWSTVAA
jgi:GDP-D-mannose 3', 5'-epimerase